MLVHTLVKPNRILLPPQFQSQNFFHLNSFGPGGHRINVIVQARAEVHSVFLDDIGGNFMTFLVDVARLMLKESFFWCFAGHTHIETLQNSVELWIGSPKFCVLGKDFFR